MFPDLNFPIQKIDLPSLFVDQLIMWTNTWALKLWIRFLVHFYTDIFKRINNLLCLYLMVNNHKWNHMLRGHCTGCPAWHEKIIIRAYVMSCDFLPVWYQSMLRSSSPWTIHPYNLILTINKSVKINNMTFSYTYTYLLAPWFQRPLSYRGYFSAQCRRQGCYRWVVEQNMSCDIVPLYPSAYF